MSPGDLFRFDYINGHCRDINRRTGIYLGEAFLHREDGKVIENHKVLLVGDSQPQLIDKTLLKYMEILK